VTIRTDITVRRKVHLFQCMFEQIFFNLLSNAVTYCEENSEIFLSFKEDQRRKGYVLEITNDGKFDYESFKKSTAVAKHGWGIGLHETRRYVEVVQGTIDFSTEQEGKVAVYVFLPFVPSEYQPPLAMGQKNGSRTGKVRLRRSSTILQSALVERRSSCGSSYRILFADDQWVNRDLVTRIIVSKKLSKSWKIKPCFDVDNSEKTVRLTVVNSGERAVVEAKRPGAHFDVVLLDYNMGAVTGVDACEMIRVDHKNTLFILLTADAESINEKDLRKFDKVLYKPFDAEKLKDCVFSQPKLKTRAKLDPIPQEVSEDINVS